MNVQRKSPDADLCFIRKVMRFSWAERESYKRESVARSIRAETTSEIYKKMINVPWSCDEGKFVQKILLIRNCGRRKRKRTSKNKIR